MPESNFDLGPMWALLFTWKNLIVVLACGGMTEGLKRAANGLITGRLGGLVEYYAPVVWCGLALLLPIGLAPEHASVGEKIMLGVILGMAADSAHDWFIKAVARMFRRGGDAGESLELPPEKKP